jgi:hypothetical protein
MTSQALELSRPLDPAEQSRGVRRLVAACSSNAALIPLALRTPKNATPDKIAQVQADRVLWALTADALGLDIIEAVKHVAVIAGAPVISAEMHRKSAIRRGCEIELVSADSEHATVRGRREGGSDWTTFTFTILDAKRAGYLDVAWTKWRKDDEGGPLRWCEAEFDLITEEMVFRPLADAPAWVKAAKKEWKQNYYRARPQMLIARASSMVTKLIDPVPTLGGVPVPVMVADGDVDDITEVPQDAPAVLEVEPAPVEYAEIVEDDPAPAPVEDWPAGWQRRIKTAGLTRQDSIRIINEVSKGAASDSGTLAVELRPAADQLLTDLLAERAAAA